MAGYKIGETEHPGLAIGRIAGEQASKALKEIRQEGASVEWRIHQLRKRCKKIRAAIRLVRPGLAAYKQANRSIRDIARRVSDHRDARVMAELVSDICHPERPDGDRNHPAERWYWTRCELAEKHGDTALAELEPVLADAAIRIQNWDVAAIGIDDAIGGLRKTLERAYARYEDVRFSARSQTFHEWRKRCKYHQLHLQLLARALPKNDEGRLAAFDKLVDLTGDEHDCSTLISHLLSEPSYISHDADVRELIAETMKRRRELRKRTLNVADGVFDESVGDLCERVESSWRANKR